MSGLADIDDRQLAWGHVALPPQGHGSHPQADAQGTSPESAAPQARRDRDLRCSPRPATRSPATSTQAVSSGDGYANTARRGVTPYLYPVSGRSPLTASSAVPASRVPPWSAAMVAETAARDIRGTVRRAAAAGGYRGL